MRFPFVPQLDASDCGAACLAMIARYHRKEIGTEKIREMAQTTVEGTSFAGLKNAAIELGFHAKAVKGNQDSFEQYFPLPAIAHVFLPEISHYHFMVLYRNGRRTFHIADPASGKKKVPKEYFFSVWTGGVLILSPGNEEFSRVHRRSHLLGFVTLLRPFIREMVEIFLISLLLFVFALAQFFYYRFLIDEIIPSGMNQTLTALSIGMICIMVFQTLSGALREFVLAYIGARIDLSIILKYFHHVLHLPLSFFDKRKVGEIMARLDDAKMIRTVISGTSLGIIIDTVLIIGVGIFLFLQCPILAAIALISVPVYAATVAAFFVPYKNANRVLMSIHARSQSHMVETLGGIFTVKSMNHTERSWWIGEFRFLETLKQRFKLEKMEITQGTIIGIAEGATRIALLWAGVHEILNGRLSLGQLISFQALVGYFIGPLKRLLTLQPTIQSASVAARRLGEIFELETEPNAENAQATIQPKTLRGAIMFDKVFFQYSTGRLVLEDIGFRVEPGSKMGIVGSSGSGKTTLMKLLLRLYPPTSGSIRIDDVDIRDMDLSYLRSQIGYIPQDICLFSGTVRENIAMHSPTCTASDIIDACSRARAMDMIASLPQRFETQISERGVSLSGGERQRIAIARAIVSKPKILLLDEATSSLDTETEAAIRESIDGLAAEGITTIINAHRLSTVESCDRIIVLDKGRIAQTGTHSELLSAEGRYRLLWNGQCTIR